MPRAARIMAETMTLREPSSRRVTSIEPNPPVEEAGQQGDGRDAKQGVHCNSFREEPKG